MTNSRVSRLAAHPIHAMALVLAFAVLAAACTTSGGEASDSGAATSDIDGSSESEGSGDTEGSGDAGSAGGAASDAPSFDYEAVDYDVEDYGGEPIQSALFDGPSNENFPPPLVDPDDIVSGGPPPDGIPPIDNPTFVSIAEATFVANDSEAVVVLEIDGEAKAYPIQIMIWHEIVNDELAGVPVTVSYCPLCNSALAFDRRLGNRVLDFGTSGRLYQSALVMYDRQTESLWAHFTGQGIIGHFAGAQLKLLPVRTLSFGQFKELYPEGQVLSIETGFSRQYGTNPYVGYDDETTEPIGSFISQDIDERLASKRRVVGIVDPSGPIAVTLDEVAASGVVAVNSEGRNLVVFHLGGLASALDSNGIADGRDVGQTAVFVSASSDGMALTFSRIDDVFVDNETGSTWTLSGQATDGPLKGEQLEAIPHLDTFWFAWATYRPGTALLE